jgi:hypothetical protein
VEYIWLIPHIYETYFCFYLRFYPKHSRAWSPRIISIRNKGHFPSPAYGILPYIFTREIFCQIRFKNSSHKRHGCRLSCSENKHVRIMILQVPEIVQQWTFQESVSPAMTAGITSYFGNIIPRDENFALRNEILRCPSEKCSDKQPIWNIQTVVSPCVFRPLSDESIRNFVNRRTAY